VKHRHSFAVLAVAAFLAAGAAQAAEPSAADRVSARALAAQAHRAVKDGDYAAAADLFARADALVHAPTLMLGLARAQVALGKLVAANETYNRIVREGVPADAQKVFVDAVEAARKELAALAPRVSWVTVTIAPTPGVKVLLDGTELPSAALGVPRAVDPGRHVVTAAVQGGARAEAVVTLEEGKSETVPLVLKAAPAPPVATASGSSPVTTGDPSSVAGSNPPPPASTTGSNRKTLGIASLGVGGAGLLVGAVTGGLAVGLHGTLAAGCTGGRCPSSLQPKLDSYNRDGLVSTIGFVAGAAFAGLGVVLLVTAPKNDGPRVGVVASQAPGGGTLGAVASF